jgi:hypothetical protein
VLKQAGRACDSRKLVGDFEAITSYEAIDVNMSMHLKRRQYQRLAIAT